MRVLLAVAVWVALVGGLAGYMHRPRSQPARQPLAPRLQAAEGVYALEVTTTFAVEPDPFALDAEDGSKPPALVVRLGDREVLRKTSRLEGGAPIRVEPLDGLVTGNYELYVEAYAPAFLASKSQAVRVRVLRDGNPLAEKSFWTEGLGKVAGTFQFSLTARDAGEHDGH